MSGVEACVPSDLEEVAALHMRVFFQSDRPPSTGLVNYYRDTFFDNPWYDSRYPSLIYRDGDSVAGFLGVIPRPMVLDGQPITAAIVHRFMVDPGASSPLAPALLQRACFRGPQELTYTDGANEIGKKAWEASRGDVVLVSSLNWSKPLRPGSFARLLLERRRRPRPLIRLTKFAFLLGDFVAERVLRRSPGAIQSSVAFREASDEELLAAYTEIAASRALVPVYERRSWEWLMDRLRQNDNRGRFGALVAENSKGKALGACACYAGSNGMTEVLLLETRPADAEEVFGELFRFAWESGTAGVTGRLDRSIMRTSWITGCRIEQRLWALARCRDPKLRLLLHNGEAMLSGLEAELWLRSPLDEL